MLSYILLLTMLLVQPVAQTEKPKDTTSSVPPGTLKAGLLSTRAEDGLRLTAMVDGGAGNRHSGLYVCLPMMGNTWASYNNLLQRVVTSDTVKSSQAQTTPRWIRIDLRGHGRSQVRGNDTLDYRTMDKTEFTKYPADVVGLLNDAIKSNPSLIDTTNLTIIGASIGANTAALLTEDMPHIKRLVLLSPGLNYRGLEPADAILAFKGQVLLVAAQNDEYSYKSVKEMAALNPDHCTLMIFEGDAHGTDLINGNPDAMQAVVDWLLKE